MNKFKDKRIISLLKKSPDEGISLALDIYGGSVKSITIGNEVIEINKWNYYQLKFKRR